MGPASLGAGASGTTLAALAATVVARVGVVLVTGRSLGSGPAAWIYSIGDMPLYRLLALVVIVGVAQVSFVAALMLATLFMAVSSLVPSLADVDTFLGSASRANFVPASTDSAAGPTLDQACAAKRAQPYGAFAVEEFANGNDSKPCPCSADKPCLHDNPADNTCLAKQKLSGDMVCPAGTTECTTCCGTDAIAQSISKLPSIRGASAKYAKFRFRKPASSCTGVDYCVSYKLSPSTQTEFKKNSSNQKTYKLFPPGYSKKPVHCQCGEGEGDDRGWLTRVCACYP